MTQLDKDGRTALYSYDAMDQLVEERTLDGQTITYEYDARANRTNVDDKLAEFDSSNRLTKFDGQGITYDEQGRRIEKRGPNGTIRFHYDGDSNRLLAETDAQGNYIREYVYGANHLLVGLKVDGSWYNYHRKTIFLFAGGYMIIEIDGYYKQSLLRGNDCTLNELKEIYEAILKVSDSAFEVASILCSDYNFEEVSLNEIVNIRYVIDTDTQIVYKPSK